MEARGVDVHNPYIAGKLADDGEIETDADDHKHQHAEPDRDIFGRHAEIERENYWYEDLQSQQNLGRQICMSTERLIVHEKVAGEFVSKRAARAGKPPAGEPGGHVVLGSLISPEAAQR